MTHAIDPKPPQEAEEKALTLLLWCTLGLMVIIACIAGVHYLLAH